MPFLTLSASEQYGREPDDVRIHYFVSTPHFQTFRRLPSTTAAFGPISADDAQKGGINDRAAIIAGADAAVAADLGDRDSNTELLPDPSLPLVVFISSESLSSIHMYAEQLSDAALADAYNLIAVDPRNHGLTVFTNDARDDAAEYTLDTKAADMIEFIEELSEQVTGSKVWKAGVHLVGCSVSGCVVLRLAAQRPEWVQSVTIPSPLREVESTENIEAWQSILTIEYGPHVPNEILTGLEHRWGAGKPVPKHIIGDFRRIWAGMGYGKEREKSVHAMWLGIYWRRKALSEQDAGKVKCPILVIEGTQDGPYEEPCGELFGQRFHNASAFSHVLLDAPFLVTHFKPSRTARLIEWNVSRSKHPNPSLVKLPDADGLSTPTLSTPNTPTMSSSTTFPPGLQYIEALHLASLKSMRYRDTASGKPSEPASVEGSTDTSASLDSTASRKSFPPLLNLSTSNFRGLECRSGRSSKSSVSSETSVDERGWDLDQDVRLAFSRAGQGYQDVLFKELQSWTEVDITVDEVFEE